MSRAAAARRLACAWLACGLLVGCLDHELAGDDGSGGRDVFIALQRDFSDFRDWMRFPLRTAVMHAGISGPVAAYLNELPPEDAREFPIGTFEVKTVEIDPATEWTIHAMYKRGGGFNAQGALGWEYVDLAINDDDVPVIMWRGERPPSDHGYESLLGGGVDPALEVDCNSCHAGGDDAAILSDELRLEALR
jgi:hypothetical protein